MNTNKSEVDKLPNKIQAAMVGAETFILWMKVRAQFWYVVSLTLFFMGLPLIVLGYIAMNVRTGVLGLLLWLICVALTIMAPPNTAG